MSVPVEKIYKISKGNRVVRSSSGAVASNRGQRTCHEAATRRSTGVYAERRTRNSFQVVESTETRRVTSAEGMITAVLVLRTPDLCQSILFSVHHRPRANFIHLTFTVHSRPYSNSFSPFTFPPSALLRCEI